MSFWKRITDWDRSPVYNLILDIRIWKYIRMIEDEDSNKERIGTQKLIEIGNERVLEKIIKRLDGNAPSWIREPTVRIAEEIGFEGVRIEDKILYLLILGNEKEIANIGEEAVEIIDKHLEYPRKYKIEKTAAEALGEIGGERAIEVLKKIIRSISAKAIYAAIESIGKIGSEKGIEELAAISRGGDPIIRKLVVEALGNIGGQKVVKILAERLGDNVGVVRMPAIDVLIEITEKVGLEIMIKELKEYVSEESTKGIRRGKKARHNVGLFVKRMMEKMRKQRQEIDSGVLSSGKPKRPDRQRGKLVRIQRRLGNG